MPGQLSFAEPNAPRRPLGAVFFAVYPDMDTAAQIAKLAQPLRGALGLTGSPLEANRLHVTLLPLGTYEGLPKGVVATASEAAATIAMPPFKVAFDRAMSFNTGPDNRPFVLCGGDGLAGLMALQRALVTAMMKAGLGHKTKSQYTPHMTLLYDRHLVTEQIVETISWTVHEFILIHSLSRQTLHVPLARWPLRG